MQLSIWTILSQLPSTNLDLGKGAVASLNGPSFKARIKELTGAVKLRTRLGRYSKLL
jgi:hypothetical protein